VIPSSSPIGSVRVRVLAPGRARGTAIVLGEPLSFWGGLDAATGVIVDPRHPQLGASLAGRIVVMPSGRGSSSSSSVLAEAVRRRTAPAGIVLHEPDPIVALGAVVAAELYGRAIPVVVAESGRIENGTTVEIESDRLSIRSNAE
jgi:predicted aconitase with swiveling domain